jgi:hypothetical protein
MIGGLLEVSGPKKPLDGRDTLAHTPFNPSGLLK